MTIIPNKPEFDDNMKSELIMQELFKFYGIICKNIGLPKDRELLDNIAQNIIAKGIVLLMTPGGKYGDIPVSQSERVFAKVDEISKMMKIGAINELRQENLRS